MHEVVDDTPRCSSGSTSCNALYTCTLDIVHPRSMLFEECALGSYRHGKIKGETAPIHWRIWGIYSAVAIPFDESAFHPS